MMALVFLHRFLCDTRMSNVSFIIVSGLLFLFPAQEEFGGGEIITIVFN